MLQFTKMFSILSFLVFVYSLYKLNTDKENLVTYIGIFITSLSIFLLSAGSYMVNIINKKRD